MIECAKIINENKCYKNWVNYKNWKKNYMFFNSCSCYIKFDRYTNKLKLVI